MTIVLLLCGTSARVAIQCRKRLISSWLSFEIRFYRIWLMMVMMMMMNFRGSCWAWSPRTPLQVVLRSQTLSTDDIASAANPLLASISRLLRHTGEYSGSILLNPKPQGHTFIHFQSNIVSSIFLTMQPNLYVSCIGNQSGSALCTSCA